MERPANGQDCFHGEYCPDLPVTDQDERKIDQHDHQRQWPTAERAREQGDAGSAAVDELHR